MFAALADFCISLVGGFILYWVIVLILRFIFPHN